MANPKWTIQSALTWTQGYLERKGDANPRVSAQWLLSAATGLSRMELYTNFDKPLTKEELSAYHGMIERRVAGEPLQYITGQAPFRTITVHVEPGVLIPRPETEVLVGEALVGIPRGEKATVLDLCTGSGCIACAIATERPEACVVATDIDDVAVRVTRGNSEALGLAERVCVYQGDLLDAVPAELRGCIDVLVSNPPYVPRAVMAQLPEEVGRFEPALALEGGEDGLDVFRRILAGCEAVLVPGGLCTVELHETCLSEALSLAGEAGMVDMRIVNDLTGRSRVLVFRTPGGPAETPEIQPLPEV